MGQRETKLGWMKATGDWTSKDDERGENEGLSRREIKALREENAKAYGRKLGGGFIAKRGKDAGHK